ncbi:peptidoglycan-binding domain-containing protein [Stigmatella sp. ncwal1]|uniref:Peptidoglycan-binding domain-containing protein n=1 Tax=Stigmatella ashevillensis TaxID=2995309 RepID=A0ABT5DEU6_9BACT|nr:peptidoglycan-binding domain-containing protein [Stigmatella ashevillena]MDC0712041.1 peptidoglycan-binding domain-containing protein [Stigmatella ashevillena]
MGAGSIQWEPGSKPVIVPTACWCGQRLTELLGQRQLESTLKVSARGEDVRALQEHLIRFGFELELMKAPRVGKAGPSDDQRLCIWGNYTTRAVRMFALHPGAGSKPEKILPADGKKLTQALVEKLQDWCQKGTRSPQNYWEFPHLKLDGKAQLIDAFGEDQGHGPQSAWHHHIRQIQEDLARVGFGVHSDALCDLKTAARPSGKYVANVQNDKQLTDLAYLVRKFQRQSKWLWRMDAEGKHLADADLDKDSTVYRQEQNSGIMDQETALVLHAWVEKKLHMVMNKFELKELHWPPDSTTVIPSEGGPAKLRQDAYDAWFEAATEIHRLGGYLGKTFASSPRGYRAGKLSHIKGNSPFSWHYSALGIDIDQAATSWDGTINPKTGVRFVLENDGAKFRVWCYADSVSPGRVIKAESTVDTSPLFHQCGAKAEFAQVAAPVGWYVDISGVMEKHGMHRIPRKPNWKVNPKSWEWWHYEFHPLPPLSWPNKRGAKPLPLYFGDYLQLYGVHEYTLRNIADGWIDHKDIEHVFKSETMP